MVGGLETERRTAACQGAAAISAVQRRDSPQLAALLHMRGPVRAGPSTKISSPPARATAMGPRSARSRQANAASREEAGPNCLSRARATAE